MKKGNEAKAKDKKMASFSTFPHRWSPYQEMNLNLVGRETDLVGRETGAPQRIWDSSICTGRVGRYTMCCYVSPYEPPWLELPAASWRGVSCSLWSALLVSVCGLPMKSGLEVSKHDKHAVNSMRCCPLLHGPAWKGRGCLPPSSAAPSFPHRTPWRLPIGRRKEQVLKGKPVKEELRWVFQRHAWDMQLLNPRIWPTLHVVMCLL